MTNLRDMLRIDHNYIQSDFGSHDGEVHIDSDEGLIHPIDRRANPVSLNTIFRNGQFISLDPAWRQAFVVVGVNNDGLQVLSGGGREGFLSWRQMAASLRLSHRVHVSALADLTEPNGTQTALMQADIHRTASHLADHRHQMNALTVRLGALNEASQQRDVATGQPLLG
jgi:hypothetical protein